MQIIIRECNLSDKSKVYAIQINDHTQEEGSDNLWIECVSYADALALQSKITEAIREHTNNKVAER